MLSKLLAPALLGSTVTGCTTLPKPVAVADYCSFKVAKAEVALPPPARSANLVAAEPANALLLLSGGSQHGAFGAGLLTRWKEREGRLPAFRTVTGISTGALLSTDAFIDRPEAAQRAYGIRAESELLKPYATRNSKGGFGAGDYLSIVKHNAVADLGPLRALLHDQITMGVLQEVVARSSGRRLLVGAVDVDSGDAVVFDMLDMAKKAVGDRDGRGEHFRDCYIDAIVASSSVPLAAKPVVIDNRMYIDGGARFGVFIDGFGTDADVDGPGPAGEPPQLYILINGIQRVAPQCGKLNAALCAGDGTDDFLKRDGAHAGWDLLGIARRSTDILTAQVYRFATADIVARYKERFGRDKGRNVHYFQIDADEMLKHDLDGKTCRKLHETDEEKLHPLQFYPSYMACLISYGRLFADEHAKDLKIPGTVRPAELGKFEP